MVKIVDIEKVIKLSTKLRKQGKKIVLAGGCFDILHIGHITFLQKAKEQGDKLFVLLEADERIKKLKGKNRPINNQNERAKILSAINSVDLVIKLPPVMTDHNYDDLIKRIKPDIITATSGDPHIKHKKRQAKLVSARIIEVTPVIEGQSTSQLVKLLGKDL